MTRGTPARFSAPPFARGFFIVFTVLAAVLFFPFIIFFWFYEFGPNVFARLVGRGAFLQNLAVFWPQRVIFARALFRADSPVRVFTNQAAYVWSVMFWIVAASAFAAAVRPVRSYVSIVLLAALYVTVAMKVVELAIPLCGWRMILEAI